MVLQPRSAFRLFELASGSKFYLHALPSLQAALSAKIVDPEDFKSESPKSIDFSGSYRGLHLVRRPSIERPLIPCAGKSSWVDPRRADLVRVRAS